MANKTLKEWPRRRCGDRDVPEYSSALPRALLDTLYSAKLGRPVGWNYKNMLEVAHHVEASHKEIFQLFLRALTAFRRTDELLASDRTGKWRKKLAVYRQARESGLAEAYKPDMTHATLIKVLFPELTKQGNARSGVGYRRVQGTRVGP
ncbi:hypothetical protein PQR65_36955 [Paraburkholderia nemoris]|uniref:DUF7829 domain-containing protein n=1 Tax=Paraburkholderia nemoris TaxID=2793076 RepID=UPI0038BA057E